MHFFTRSKLQLEKPLNKGVARSFHILLWYTLHHEDALPKERIAESVSERDKPRDVLNNFGLSNAWVFWIHVHVHMCVGVCVLCVCLCVCVRTCVCVFAWVCCNFILSCSLNSACHCCFFLFFFLLFLLLQPTTQTGHSQVVITGKTF